MKISVSTDASVRIAADWLVCGVSADGEWVSLPEPLRGPAKELREGNDFEAKANETATLFRVPGISAPRVLLVGVGKESAITPMVLSHAAGTALRQICGKKRSRVALCLESFSSGPLSIAAKSTSLVSGACVGVVGQDLYRSEPARHPLDELILGTTVNEQADVQKGVDKGEILAGAVNLARELVNRSPAEIYPESFCARASELAKGVDISVEILAPEQLKAAGMECILAVGGGSARSPRLLILRSRRATSPNAPTLGFVGKGITFDSGGLSIKTAEGMTDMKCDMAGAATVVAAHWAIARLGIPVNLMTLAPLAENMPSSSAYRPGDVLRAKNGKTIEILNTDAEGRLVLADALAHAVDLGASHIVDLATLTGACVVALGMKVAGVMTNQEAWGKTIQDVAGGEGERVWPLPMFEEYDELIKSSVADMKNTGGRWGGAISAAKLLGRFVGNVPWAHLDIAGPAYSDKDAPFQDGGGTGFFVRSLVALAQSYADHPPEISRAND